jgi:hypothetical protein
MGSSLVEGQSYVRLGESRLTIQGIKLEVTNIPSGYRFLMIYINLISHDSAGTNMFRINGVNTNNFITQSLKANSSGVISAFNENNNYANVLDLLPVDATAALFMQINQFPLSGLKGFSCVGGCDDRIYNTAGSVNSPIEIHTVSIEAAAGSYSANSEIIVYGVR